MKVGYIRVSSIDQNPDRQLVDIICEKIFVEKASAGSLERPVLKRTLDFIREGDTLYVHSIDRLARNTTDLLNLVQTITEKKVTLHFVKENLIFGDEDVSGYSRFLLSVLGAFAEFERSIIRERQAEGIKLAKEKGVYKGRKRALNDQQIQEIRDSVQLGVSVSKLARKYKVSRATVYNMLKN